MSSEYAEVDPARSKQLLKQAGVSGDIDVRVMYAADNVRRANEFQLLKPALAEAGFNLVDAKSAKWGEKLGDGTYDAVVFDWQSETPAVTESGPTFVTGGINNLIGYSNKKVDSEFDALNTETDEAKQIQILADVEKELYEDAIGLTLYQFPSANISNGDRVSGLEPAILAPTMFYGFWNWKAGS